MDRLSISTAPLNSYLNKKYYDLKATLYLLKMLSEEDVVDGFEFQLLAEWNPEYAPLDKDTKYDRQLEWENSRKYEVAQIVELLTEHELPILSIHANRDIGICLCSNEKELNQRGRILIEQALILAEKTKAGVCVFHLWDAWMEEIDFAVLKHELAVAAAKHTSVRVSVKNLPTYVKSTTPFQIIKDCDWVTLDTKWSDMYGELDKFETIRDRIANIHLRGTYRNGKWTHANSSTKFASILKQVKGLWKSSRLLTLEPSGDFSDVKWKDLVSAIRQFRR